MTMGIDDPITHQERNAVPAGQDQVENNDEEDNLQDADTLADLADTPYTKESNAIDKLSRAQV